MKPTPFILLLFLLLGSISLGNSATQQITNTKIPQTFSGQVDMCLGCHLEEPDKAHARQVLGCFECHLGNPLAGTKKAAHKGMIKNPGELSISPKTCGQSGCHVKEVDWVQNSLMATNRGIISTLRYYWGETDSHSENITIKTIKEKGLDSPALDYFRKMCGSCHIGLEKGVLPDFLSRKGGGCSACHNSMAGIDSKPREKRHPQIIRFVPMANCVKCHNRSGRIGLSYQGMFESEGYGTPFIDGDFAPYQLDDGRFYLPMKPDIHYAKGLICIDCHTQKEIMGDGNMKAHIEEQIEIKCVTCHRSQNELNSLAKKEGILNDNGQARDLSKRPISKINIKKLKNGQIALLGKKDNSDHILNPPLSEGCNSGAHSRLTCQACHATWVPQCYGCHVKADKSQKQLDKLSGKMTYGSWTEFRSFIRYETPALGVNRKENKVVILVPG